MKKVSILILSTLLVFGFLGCKQPTDGGERKYNFVVGYGNYTNDIKPIIDKFNWKATDGSTPYELKDGAYTYSNFEESFWSSWKNSIPNKTIYTMTEEECILEFQKNGFDKENAQKATKSLINKVYSSENKKNWDYNILFSRNNDSAFLVIQ